MTGRTVRSPPDGMPGRYESHHLRAVDPARPRGVWIRHTTYERPGEAPTGALWCTVWDAEAGPPYAVKQSLPAPAHAVFTGRIEVGGRRIEVAGWRGMVGHNWGTEHAERWVWLHALGFAEAPGAWLDVVLGRVRLGGRTTPWVANGAVELDGSRLRLGGIGRIRATRVAARPGALEAVIGGADATLRVSVAAPLDQTVAFVYADPGAGEHHALNCSIAQARLRVERPGRPPVELATAFGGAYELGVREGDHGVPVQPFPDP